MEIMNSIPVNGLRHLKRRITNKSKDKWCEFHRDHVHDNNASRIWMKSSMIKPRKEN